MRTRPIFLLERLRGGGKLSSRGMTITAPQWGQ
jgi:hypothetical protein